MSDFVGKKDIIDSSGINEEIGKVKKSFEGLKKTIGEVAQASVDMQATLGGQKGYKELIGEGKKHKKNTDDLTLAMKEHEKIKRQLAQAQAKHSVASSKENQQLIETRERTKALNREYAEAAKKKYNLNKQSNGLVTAFKNLAKSVVGYMIAMVAVQRVIQFFSRDLLELNKKLDAQRFAMSTIIKDSIELKTTQAELLNMAKNYGQNILVLTERYIKFRAAAIQSNITASQTMKIFNSTAKAAGVLGLKSDELNGVFLALEQMLSKGKVTTEELRRQLGERLPGAMGIMADAVGVTIDELDKMMKKGELLSSMALPKFADQIEIAYGIQSITKIDTLVAAHERLKTSWIEFLDSLNTSKAYTGILNLFTDIIDGLGKVTTTTQKAGIKYGSNLISIIQQEGDAIDDLTKRREFYNKKVKELEEMLSATSSELTMIETEYKKSSFWDFLYGDMVQSPALRQAEIDLRKTRIATVGLTEVLYDLQKILKVMGDAKPPLENFEFVKMESAIKGAEEAYEMLEKIGFNSMSDYTKAMVESYNKEGKNYKDYLSGKLNIVEEYLADAKKQNEEEEKSYTESGVIKKLTEQGEVVKKLQKEYQDLYKLRSTQSKLFRELSEKEINDKKAQLGIEETTWNVLSQQAKDMNLRREEAQRIYANWGELHKEMQMALYDEPKTGSSSDDRLALARMENERLINEFIIKQTMERQARILSINQDELLSDKEKADKIKQREAADVQELLGYRKYLNEGLLDIAEEGTTEYERIITDRTNFERQMAEEASQEIIDNQVRDADILQEKMKVVSDSVVDQYYYQSDQAVLAAQKYARKRIETENLTNRKIEKLQRELVEHKIEMDILAVKEMIKDGRLTVERRAEMLAKLDDLEKQHNDFKIENSKKNEQDEEQILQDWARAVAEIYNSLFDLIGSLYARQMEQAKAMYQADYTYAGASVEARIQAEKKYEREEAKIKKKQAAAQKMQSAFNVAIQMLEVAPKAIAGDPFSIASLIAGGISLAAIAAEPIPAFEKGGHKDKAGLAKVSEKGQEIFIDKKTGKSYLTPKEETIAHFPAGEFIPHDETQRLLAQYAMNQQAEILDMSGTNRHLENIERNTRKRGETSYYNDYKIVYRNGIKSKIKV